MQFHGTIAAEMGKYYEALQSLIVFHCFGFKSITLKHGEIICPLAAIMRDRP